MTLLRQCLQHVRAHSADADLRSWAQHETDASGALPLEFVTGTALGERAPYDGVLVRDVRHVDLSSYRKDSLWTTSRLAEPA